METVYFHKRCTVHNVHTQQVPLAFMWADFVKSAHLHVQCLIVIRIILYNNGSPFFFIMIEYTCKNRREKNITEMREYCSEINEMK